MDARRNAPQAQRQSAKADFAQLLPRLQSPFSLPPRLPAMRTLSAVLLGAVLLIAAGCSEPKSAPRAQAEKIDYFLAPCEPTLSDSARVECNALAAVVKDDGFVSVVTQFRRTGSGYCVITYPNHPSIVDGGAIVMLDSAGVVQSVSRGDHVECPARPNP